MNASNKFKPDTCIVMYREGKAIGVGVMPRWKAESFVKLDDGWRIVSREECEQAKKELKERVE